MTKKTNNNREDPERQRQLAFQRLGSDNPSCRLCGESDWRCLELHHIAGKANDPTTVILCRNCHRKQSNPAKNKKAPAQPSLMDQIGHFLEGLAELLIALAEKLKEFGKALIEGARQCPSPWGYGGSQAR